MVDGNGQERGRWMKLGNNNGILKGRIGCCCHWNRAIRMANKNGFQQKSVHFPFPPAISLVDIGIPTSLGTLLLLLPDAVEKREQGLDVE